MGGKCESISILWVDSWRVKSDNGVSYEAISHTMHKLLTQPRLDSRISFERYATAMKIFWGVDIEVSVNDGIATFKEGSIRISSFMIGDPGGPYCMIPGEQLKLLNKLLGSTINNSKIKFCKCEDTEFLFLIDKEYYHTNL